MSAVERLAGLILAALLLRSGLSHAANPYMHLESIYGYGVLGDTAGVVAAAVLPYLHLVLGVALLGRRGLAETYALTAVLFVVFLLAQGLVIAAGRQASCGCFGPADNIPVGWSSLATSGACLAAALLGVVATYSPRRLSGAAVADRLAVGYVRPGFTLTELLVSIAVTGVLLGLLVGAVQKVRAAAARASCQNSLRQLALAAHQYEGRTGAMPPGITLPTLVGRTAPPLRLDYLGWPARLLPFIEQDALWQITLSDFRQRPVFYDPPPHRAFGTAVKTFACVADGRVATPQLSVDGYLVGLTSYLGVAGLNHLTPSGVLFPDSAVRVLDVTDGTSQTLLIGERPPSMDFHFGWWYAGLGQDQRGSGDMILGVRESLVSSQVPGCSVAAPRFTQGRLADPCDALHFWSFHPGGANFAFCDGSVRFLSYTAEPILPALASRSAGEPVEFPD